jgi:hypothetical protein
LQQAFSSLLNMTSQQTRYIDSLLDKSEQDLLFEIARQTLSGVRNSGYSGTRGKDNGPIWIELKEQKPEEVLNRVPEAPVNEQQKQVLVDYLDVARERFATVRLRLYVLLCDSTTQKPKDMALDIATGQIKDVVAGVAGALLAQYSIAVSIGIPVAVLAMKQGLFAFCATRPVGLIQ